MSKTWKWILGITLGLVILAGVGSVAASFFGFGHMSVRGEPAFYGHPMMDEHEFGRRAPMAEGFDRDNWRGPSYGYDKFHSPRGGFDYGMPMHGGRGFGGYGYMPLPFLFFGGLLRLIFPLAVLGAVGYFAYKKGKKDGMLSFSAPSQEQESTA